MSELKKCPFCNGEAEFVRKGTGRYSNQVSCMHCGTMFEDGATFNHEDGWNTRPREEELEKEKNKLLEEKAELTKELATMDKAHYRCSQRCLVHIEDNDKLKARLYAFVCYKCDTALGSAPGIGSFCPNAECNVSDGTGLWKK
jgi:hypothetical protein